MLRSVTNWILAAEVPAIPWGFDDRAKSPSACRVLNDNVSGADDRQCEKISKMKVTPEMCMKTKDRIFKLPVTTRFGGRFPPTSDKKSISRIGLRGK